MPYVLVYEQNWSAGNSLFSQQQYYDRATEGSDSLYPEVNNAESVQVNIGDGPSGENTLDNWTGVGSDNDYVLEGVSLHLLTASDSGGSALSIEEGKASITYTPTTQSLADNVPMGYCPLLHLKQYNDYYGIFSLSAYPNGSGPTWQLEIQGDFTLDDSYTFTPVAGTPIIWDIEFKRSDTGAGYIRVYQDGTLIYNQDPAYVAGYPTPSGAFPAFSIRTAWIGFNGLIGKATNFRLYRIAEMVPAPSPINNATQCCNAMEQTTSSGAGVSGGIPPGVNPYSPLVPPVYTCSGLGTVPSDADPTRPEVFD